MRGNPREAINRIELIVGLAGMDLPAWAVRKLIASCINLVVQVSRLPGGKRKITSITELTGMEGDTIAMHEIFSFVQTGMNTAYGAEGYFSATGIRPQSPEQAEGTGCGLAERNVRRATFSITDQPGYSPMTSEPQPPWPGSVSERDPDATPPDRRRNRRRDQDPAQAEGDRQTATGKPLRSQTRARSPRRPSQ